MSEIFDVCVINSPLAPKGRMLRISGRNIASASIEVPEICLVERIPEKHHLPYSHREAKQAFGPNGKVLPNVRTCSRMLD